MEETGATIPSTSHCKFHAQKTIPLVPIHLFTIHIVSLGCEELLTQSLSKSVTPHFQYSHTKSFLPSKKFLCSSCFFFFFSFFVCFFYFHRTLIMGQSFLHGFQSNFYQHFSYVCSTRQTTFSIKQIPQCI